MQECNVADLMTRQVVTCTSDEPLLDVVKKISSKKFSCIIVVDGDTPVGIITERDLVEVLSDTLQGVTWDDLNIKHFMTSPVITITEDLTLYEAVLLARTNKIRHFPVVNTDGVLVGILTQSNIIEGYYND